MEKNGIDPCRRWARHFRWVVVAVMMATLSACAGSSGFSSFAAGQCKQISKRAEAKINWARVPEIEIRVRNGEYSPMVTRLKQGRPYVLRIRNRDDETRVFRARDFFTRNAVIAAALEGQRAPEGCIGSVSLPPRQTAEIRMVAVTDGTYEFEDNMILVPFVMSMGPNGAIIVEERRETADLK